MPTEPTTTAELVDILRKSGIVPPEQLATIPSLGLPPEPKRAAAILVAKGIVTKFQAQQLIAGRHKGFRIGSHVIRDLLGRGGMGAVYLAEHVELQRKVAIKILVPGKDDDHKLAIERFQREARAAAALDHPNIVRIFDVARHGETPYLVMEYVEGETLQQVLERDLSIPYPTATECVAQAAAGLQHAFEKGFIHRDIKPGNLIRDRSGAVKILDMGLARSTQSNDSLTERFDNGAVVGTADFIAPEQGMNQPVDIRADIYALGATFFALIIGKPPFEGNTTQKLLQHQLRSAPTLGSIDATLPKGLSAVVAKMLAKKPDDRYRTPAEVIAALAPWLGSSARIVAGLSRTNLSQGADLQATLAEVARGSSRRLNSGGTLTATDSAEVDTSQTAQDTGSIAAAITTREPVFSTFAAESNGGRRGRGLLYALLGVAVLATGGVAGWLAFGRDKDPVAPDNRSRAEQEPRSPAGGAPSNPNTGGTPKPDPVVEREFFKLDVAKFPDFKTTRQGFKKASGDDVPFVKGVYMAGWKADTLSEWECATVEGAKALAFTNLNETASAQIGIDLEKPEGLGLKFEPGQRLRARVTYRTAGTGRGNLYFQTFGDWKSFGTVALPNTGGEWKTVEVVATRGEAGLRCLVDNIEPSAGNTLYVRGVTITDAGKGPPPKSAPTTPVPTAPNFNDMSEGTQLYALDTAKIAPFRVVKEQRNRTSGDEEVLPTGLGCHAWKEKGVGEFRCEKVDGVPALGIVNLNDEMSGQFFFQLEGDMKLPLQPGKAYRVKVGYLTKNDAAGHANVQVTPGYRGIASAPLPGTEGKWKTAIMNFTRPPTEDKVEVRMTIDNTTVGEGNTLWIRSVEIVELVPPGKK